MRRAPGSPSAGLSLAGVLVALLAIVVVGGTAFGYSQWQSEIDQATDGTFPAAQPRAGGTPLPAAPTSAPTQAPEPAYETPTFDLLKPTGNRPRPVVLVVGDGYAAGRGASSPDLAFPALLATDLGWDVETSAATGAGYVSEGSELADLLAEAPESLAPDLVIVQGAYGSNATADEAKQAVAELAAALQDRYADVPLVVLTSISPEPASEQAETRERTLARAWREVPGALVLRPLTDGWGTAAFDDEGHRIIADQLEQALRDAGLAKQP